MSNTLAQEFKFWYNAWLSSHHQANNQIQQADKSENVSITILSRLRQIFGKKGNDMLRTLKSCPEIFDSGEIYHLTDEMIEVIEADNIRHMESKNKVPHLRKK